MGTPKTEEGKNRYGWRKITVVVLFQRSRKWKTDCHGEVESPGLLIQKRDTRDRPPATAEAQQMAVIFALLCNNS